MKISTAILMVTLFGTLASPAAAGDKDKTSKPSPPLTLALSAHVAPAPAEVTAKISVTPDMRSRSLVVEWWQEDGAGGSHQVTLDGDRAAARQDFAIKRMEAGEYVVRAVLVRDDGSTIQRESRMIVVGEGSTFAPAGKGTDLIVVPSTPRH